MPLTPSQILSANSRLFGGGGSNGVLSRMQAQRQAKRDELADLLDQEEQDKPSKGIFDSIKSGIGSVIEPVASGLDYARAATLAATLEAGDALREIAGKEGISAQDDHGFSFEDIKSNINRRVGVGDVLEENTLSKGLPLNVKRALGGAGDIALDPLNYVTLGTGTAAKQGLRKVATVGGDDAARLLAREGVEAADAQLAKQFALDATEEASAQAARDAMKAGQLPAMPSTAASPGLLPTPGPPPTVRSILGEGVTERGLGRTLSAIERQGAGGIGLDFGRFGAPTLVAGETLGKIPGVGALGDLGRAAKFSNTGQAFRKAIVPFTETRDKFGQAIAEAMPGIGHRRAQLVDAAKVDLDHRISNIVESAAPTPETLGAIRAALDVGGTVDAGLLQLDGLPEAQELLTELAAVRDDTYDAWIRAGKRPDELMSKDEYLRHRLTEMGKEAYGISDPSLRPGTKSGNLKARTREGSLDEKLAEDGFASYIDDPVRLVSSSYHYAQEVLGNAGAVDALEDVARKIRGFDPKRVVRHKAAEGFVQVAPNRWVEQTIYDDLFNLSKSGTQSSIVRGWDTFSSLVKRQTLFNPIAFGPYFSQNMATGVAMNAARLGVGPAEYVLTHRLHKAVKAALAEGGERGFDNALARLLPDAEEQALAKELRTEGIFGAERSLFDDIAEADTPFVKPSKARWVAELGTKRTAAVNQYGEEMLRGAAFVKARAEGLASDQAANVVRQTHLDYSALGRTRFERDKINRFIFFPTWLMRAPTAIVRSYAHRPGLFNLQAKAELGKDWSDRPRNQYGDIIGSRWSGPVSFLTGLGFEGGDAFDKPTELLHPILQAAFDEDSRKITDILPPLSNVLKDEGGPTTLNFGNSRLGKVVGDEPSARERFAKSLLGFRTGVDYDAERGKDQFETMLDERKAKLKENPDLPETTPKIRLVLAALRAGVPAAEAYSLNKGGLAKALVPLIGEEAVSRILDDSDAKLPKALPDASATGIQGLLGGDNTDLGLKQPSSAVVLDPPEIDFGGDGQSDNLVDKRGTSAQEVIRQLLAEYVAAQEGTTGKQFLGNVRRGFDKVTPW